MPDPGAPGVAMGLAARAVGITKIELSWTAPADPDIAGYRIEWSADGASGWRDLAAHTGSTATAYDDTGLAARTTRHYRVSAINAERPGSPSETAHATTGAGAPEAPTGLVASAVGNTKIGLAWQEPTEIGGSAITGYRIERSADGVSGWRVLVPDTGNADTAYRDTGLPSATTRHYRISAINGDGPGVASGVAHATTGSGAPDAPWGLVATAKAPGPGDTTTQIDLAWEKPAEFGRSAVTGYRIEWSANGTSSWRELVADTGSTDRTRSDSGLPAPTTRHYRVFAINADGTGPASNVAHATTDDVVRPVLVSARTSTTGSTAFLGFDEDIGTISSPAVSAFTVTADGVSVGVGLRDFIFDTAVGRTGVRLRNLSPTIKQGQSVVVTYSDPNPGTDDATGVIQDTAGNDAASFTTGENGVPEVVNESTAAPAAPDAPTGLEATTAGDTRIDLAWEPPAYNGGGDITGYRIEVSEGVDPLVWTELVASHDAREGGAEDAEILTAHAHTGLPRAATRHYRVSAINAGGTGPASESASATTTMVAPGAPTGLAATAEDASPSAPSTQIDLAWTAPAVIRDSDITGYRIEWSRNGTSDWKALVANTASTDVAYSDTGLGSETRRHYRVFAINAFGTGPASNVDSATTEDIEGPKVSGPGTVFQDGVEFAAILSEPLDATDANLPRQTPSR